MIVERTYDAPIERVWEAITDKNQMKHWFFEVNAFKAEVGFEFEFSAHAEGKTYLHQCKVVEVNPVTKLAYTWRYEGYEGQSLVTFELLSKAEDKTHLKLTHSDLDTFPPERSEFSQENFNEGWKSLLGDSLRKFVEMESFTKSIRINAGAKDIWNIVLNPDNQWGLAFGGGATAETDWKEGSPIIWKDMYNNIGANGIVEIHQPGESLQLHYYDDVHPKPNDTPGEYYEKFTLVTDKNECVLTIEIGKIARRDVPSHQVMWDRAMVIIKELAEK